MTTCSDNKSKSQRVPHTASQQDHIFFTKTRRFRCVAPQLRKPSTNCAMTWPKPKDAQMTQDDLAKALYEYAMLNARQMKDIQLVFLFGLLTL